MHALTHRSNVVRTTTRALLLLTLILPGCSDDSGTTGPPPAEMPGVWMATESEFVRVAAPQEKVDIVALGGSVTLLLAPNGTFILSLTLPGQPTPWVREGVWFSDVDVLRLEYQVGGAGVNEFDMDWRDDVFRLTGADSVFDFGAGPQAAKWNLRLVKPALADGVTLTIPAPRPPSGTSGG